MKIIIEKTITANGMSGDELTDMSKFSPKRHRCLLHKKQLDLKNY